MMFAIEHSLLMACALGLGLASVTSRAMSGERSWEGVAQAVLLERLSHERPQVAQWHLTARVSEQQRVQLEQASIERATVTQVGARSAVRLEWRDNDRRQVATVWFVTQGLRAVLTTQRKYAVGGVFDQRGATLADRDVMTLGCEPVVDAGSLEGMRTKVLLQNGDVICRDKVEAVPPVVRGGQVTVQSFSGGVVVTGKAVAQADGEVGAIVKVRNPSNGSFYSARVTGEREVTVHE